MPQYPANDPSPVHADPGRRVASGSVLGTGARPATAPSSAYGSAVDVLHEYAPVVGRVLLSQIFLISGLMKLFNWAGTEAEMARHGMPLVPLLLGCATAVELLGGLALLLGYGSRTAAGILFLYLIPTTLIFHNFWAYQGTMQQMQLFNFLKNLAIMGAMALVVGFGPGPCSVERGCR